VWFPVFLKKKYLFKNYNPHLKNFSLERKKKPATDASHLKARRDEFWFNPFWVGDETIFYLVESLVGSETIFYF